MIRVEGKRQRWEALDSLRGLTVLLMLPVNAAMEFEAIPPWFKHAPGPGMTLADFIMPAFLFALGLSSSLSLRRRLAERGLARTAAHALARSALLFAFGTIGFFLVWERRNWEILQMLGATGALAFPFLFMPPRPRAAAALCLVGAVEAARQAFFDGAFRAWYASGIGGPAGAVPLAAVAIAASALGEAVHGLAPRRRGARAAGAGAATLAAGLALSAIQPPDKHMVTASYLLIATGTAALALAAIETASAARGAVGGAAGPTAAGVGASAPGATAHAAPIAGLLGALGRNALFAYMGGGILTLAARAVFGTASAAPIAWSASVLVLGIVALVCLVLDRKGIYLRL